MSEVFELSIPADNDGYVLLQCEHCGEYFKISASDFNEDGILHIVCPACGLGSECFFTDDVVELARAIVTNYALDAIYDAFKGLERSSKKGPVTFKAGRRPDHEPENPVHTGIQALEITSFSCCGRTAKIKPLLKMTGCKCPLCGVMNFEFK